MGCELAAAFDHYPTRLLYLQSVHQEESSPVEPWLHAKRFLATMAIAKTYASAKSTPGPARAAASCGVFEAAESRHIPARMAIPIRVLLCLCILTVASAFTFTHSNQNRRRCHVYSSLFGDDTGGGSLFSSDVASIKSGPKVQSDSAGKVRRWWFRTSHTSLTCVFDARLLAACLPSLPSESYLDDRSRFDGQSVNWRQRDKGVPRPQETVRLVRRGHKQIYALG